MPIEARGAKACREYTLLDAKTSTTSGEWADVSGWRRATVHITGIVTATCQIRGCATPTKPLDSEDHIQIGSDITSDTLYEITAKLKWLKVKISAYTSGTISAYAIGDQFVSGI